MAAGIGSLKLLESYNSDESEEEIESNSKVSTKRTLLEENDSITHKKQRSESSEFLLPVPTSLSAMYSNDKKHIDNPFEHQGRSRSFPHERGNWSTLVYIPCQEISPSEDWNKLLGLLQDQPGSKLQLVDNPHVSLSRTVVLRHHWIDSVVSDLRQQYASLTSFELCLSGYKVLVNDEKTRTFLVIPVISPTQQVQQMSKICDQALANFRLPPFYQDGDFHVSVAWCLGDERISVQSAVRETLKSALSSNVWSVNVDHVCCSTGNKLHVLPLRGV